MGPDWYIDAAMQAEAQHDPDRYDGREWDDLTPEEVDEAVYDIIYDRADALEDA